MSPHLKHNRLGLPPVDPVSDFAGLRDFIEVQAGKNYRFVVILDEFERLAGNSHFNSDFFANLRT
ncbi:MAG: hypothetical protein GY862_02760, partial [Gammaproteobacteria bacterium]|nr:hypothetical protein [Gammaproteobacteria bacterium]